MRKRVLFPDLVHLPFRLRRRPIQFRMSATVEAGEAVTGFASGIRHGGKGYERSDRLESFYALVRDASVDWTGDDPVRDL